MRGRRCEREALAGLDADGQPFSSEKRYLLHFSKEQIPPVRGFWSLTMYDDRQLFTANPITGTSDFGPYPSNMDVRNAFRAPGIWNVDAIFSAPRMQIYSGNCGALVSMGCATGL